MLILLPNLIAHSQDPERVFSLEVKEAVQRLDGLIAESFPQGRRYLKLFRPDGDRIPIAQSTEKDIRFLCEPLQKGETWGLISDCGLPCLADPGARIVAHARSCGIAIQALMGPSAIVQAIMLSGLFAQRFSFSGYLPKDPHPREKELLALQSRSEKLDEAIFFMCAPHQNSAVIADILRLFAPTSMLFFGQSLASPEEFCSTKTISIWRNDPPKPEKVPCIFGFRSV